MGYCLGYALIEGGDAAFSMDASAVTFGPGALAEVGEEAAALGLRRVALFTDARLAELAPVAEARRSLGRAGVDVVVYDTVHVEPTDRSFAEAARFAAEGRFDGYVSVGGGSVIDTCKAALLYATYPADFYAYVNRPIGEGREVPGPLPPHIACPTTTGTGAECTGIAVFDDTGRKAKTGIASRKLRPTRAIVDPWATRTMPKSVVAASGFDVVTHALESYTARPYSTRPRAPEASKRPMSQGANPWSDMGCKSALELAGRYLLRAVSDAEDEEAREGMAWAATLAGIAFGNAGVHLPHAMSYAVSGLCRSFTMPGYPEGEPLVPHGVSVVVNAPAVFRALAKTSPARHLDAAARLGADVRGAGPEDAGEVLATHLGGMMRAAGVPNGLSGVGYGETDVDALAAGTIVQARLVSNAPCAVDEDVLRGLFRGAFAYW
ncbi:hydroxyacid-oxoacid transhydrogenase [Polyangium mundeleinium]|uniref:hydroxyacid-oxoacid transhydrogenase n=1 Tax=Polyangium mundeleinium TaxID=2995306 RepID=A0ABT5EUH5_9BACT|nr:hydroxyacid-oxoacid transhydrogenase [Polyangium mundeleinium]MDC0744401.1 iron-containing alcohol dehydrogenase [Polyangium mundeleinium]